MTDLTCWPCIKVRLNQLEKELASLMKSTDAPGLLQPGVIELLKERAELRAAYKKLRPEDHPVNLS